MTQRLGSAKIVVGTHDQLISVGGKYAQMFNAQAGWYVS